MVGKAEKAKKVKKASKSETKNLKWKQILFTSELSHELYHINSLSAMKAKIFFKHESSIWKMVQTESFESFSNMIFYGKEFSHLKIAHEDIAQEVDEYIKDIFQTLKEMSHHLHEIWMNGSSGVFDEITVKKFNERVLSYALGTTGLANSAFKYLSKQSNPFSHSRRKNFSNGVAVKLNDFKQMLNTLPGKWKKILLKPDLLDDDMIKTYQSMCAEFVVFLFVLTIDTYRLVGTGVERDGFHFEDTSTNFELATSSSHVLDDENVSKIAEKNDRSLPRFDITDNNEDKPNKFENVWFRSSTNFCTFWTNIDCIDPTSILQLPSEVRQIEAVSLANELSCLLLKNCRSYYEDDFKSDADECFCKTPLSKNDILQFCERLSSKVLRVEVGEKKFDFRSKYLMKMVMASLDQKTTTFLLDIGPIYKDLRRKFKDFFLSLIRIRLTNVRLDPFLSRFLHFISNIMNEALRIALIQEEDDDDFQYRYRWMNNDVAETVPVNNPKNCAVKKLKAKKSKKRKLSEVEQVEVSDNDLNGARALRPSSVVGCESVNSKYSDLLKQIEKDERIPEEWKIRFRTILTINTQLQSETENLKSIADMFL